MESDKKLPSSSSGDGSHKKKWHHQRRKAQHGAKTIQRPEKFQGEKDELDGNYFDCAGRGQKTAQKIADCIGQEHECGGVSCAKVITQTVVVVPLPTRPTDATTTSNDADCTATVTPPDALDISDCQSAKKIVDCQIQHQKENRQKSFSLVWQRRAESTRAKIKAHHERQNIEQALNGIESLRITKLTCFNAEDKKRTPQKVHKTKAALCHLKQGKDSDQACQIKFMNAAQAIEQCGASIGEDPMTRTMVCKDLGCSNGTMKAAELARIPKTVRDCAPGVALILGDAPAQSGD